MQVQSISHITNKNYDEKIKEISEKLKTVEENLNDKMSVDLKMKKIDVKIYILHNEIKVIEKLRSLEEFENKINMFESILITMKKGIKLKIQLD